MALAELLNSKCQFAKPTSARTDRKLSHCVQHLSRTGIIEQTTSGRIICAFWSAPSAMIQYGTILRSYILGHALPKSWFVSMCMPHSMILCFNFVIVHFAAWEAIANKNQTTAGPFQTTWNTMDHGTRAFPKDRWPWLRQKHLPMTRCQSHDPTLHRRFRGWYNGAVLLSNPL